MDVFNRVAANVIRVLYKDLGASAIMAFLFMFLWMECKQNGKKDALAKWFYGLRKSHEFRIAFIFVFYVSMVLFRTILGRQMYIVK